MDAVRTIREIDRRSATSILVSSWWSVPSRVMVSSQVNEPRSDAPCRMQATSPNCSRNKHVEEGVTATPISFAGTEGRRAMAVRALCHWKLGCEYHLEVFERCRRGTLMNRVEILRMSVVYFLPLFDFGSLKTKHSRKKHRRIWNTSCQNVERHRHTVLERRTRLGGYCIRLPTSTFSLSLNVSTPARPITCPSTSANMSHVSPLLARGSGGRRWKRTSRSLLMVRKCWSNIQTDDAICFYWQTTTKWSSGRSGRDRGFSLARAESCWVQTDARRAWQLLVILAQGRRRTRASFLSDSQPTCRPAPSRPRPWDSRDYVRTDSLRHRQSDHPTILVWENKSWVIRKDFIWYQKWRSSQTLVKPSRRPLMQRASWCMWAKR